MRSNDRGIQIDHINTSKFLFDLKSVEFIRKTYDYPEFDLKSFKTLREQLLVYMVLFYDMNSPIRNDRELHFLDKKKEAAKCAGLLDSKGKMDEEVMSLIIGDNEEFNAAIAKYVWLQHSTSLMTIVALEYVQQKAFKAIQNEPDSKNLKLFKDATEELERMLGQMTGEDERKKIIEAIQKESGKVAEGLRMEDMVDRHAKGNIESPYPNYEQDPVKFISHRKPKK